MERLSTHSNLLLNALVVMFVMSSNVYLIESGSIQINHVFLILFFCASLLVNMPISRELAYQFSLDNQRYVVLTLSLFVVYILVTNSVTSIIYSSLNPMVYSSYYVFNLLVFMAFFLYFSKENNASTSVFYYSMLFLLPIEVLMLYFDITRVWKEGPYMLYFNNPNQMAYHALLVWSLLAAMQTRKNMVISILISGFFALVVILYASSFAATLAISFGLLIFFCRNFHNTAIKISFILFFIALILYFFVFDLNLEHFSISEKIQRKGGLEGILQNVFTDRGYDNFASSLKSLVFGKGGFYGHNEKEIHSTIGNILISYGLVGLTIFVIFLWFVFYNKPIVLFYMFLPVMIYGIVHNGIRQPFFWIYLALVLSHGKTGFKQK